MGLKTDEANLRADANQTGEIDLYDELVAFSNLSPENQHRGPAKSLPHDPAEPSLQAAGGFVYADFARSEAATVDPATQTSFELVGGAELQHADGPSADRADDFSSGSPYEPAVEPERKPSSERPQAGRTNQGGTGDLDLAYLLRVTGPLILPGMTVNPDSSKLVCRDCRSESSSRDMFCVTCGGLLESAEASSLDGQPAAASLACGNCDYVIEEGEIFCPSCGAAT